MKGRLIAFSVLVCTLVAGCGPADNDVSLAELEVAIAERHLAVERFEARMDSIKRSVPASASDSVLWEHFYDMYEVYRYFNIDTASRYVSKLEEYALRTGDRDQISLTQGARVRMLRSSTEEFGPAVELFEQMDTVGLKKTTVRKYYSVGITLYMACVMVATDSRQASYASRLQQLRDEYTARFFDFSVHCRLMTAIAHTDYGKYEKAEKILLDMLENDELTMHEQTQVQYYLADVYSCVGRREECRELLIRTAIQELQIPVRDYHAMYDLAVMFNDDKNYMMASDLISVATSDAIAINYYSRLRRASSMQSLVAKAAYDSEHQRSRLSYYIVVIVCVALVICSFLLYYSFRQRRKLRRAYKIVTYTNERLENVNAELKDANMIKDNYVLRYMKLSTHYIRQVDETRKEIRRTAKSGGLDAVMALLRSPRYTDEEYKRFYKMFDSTFVGLFPHFVDKVNEIMPEDSRLQIKPDGSLSTEIRILAIIRLGITKSPEIAEVLNCAVNTVYKYRETIRNKALCPKEDFEKIIKRIDF